MVIAAFYGISPVSGTRLRNQFIWLEKSKD